MAVCNEGQDELQAELEVQMRLRKTEMMRCCGELTTVTQEKDKLVKRCKKLENVLKVVQSSMPSLQTQKDQICIDLKRTEEQTRRSQDVRSFAHQPS